jgi:signal transduction histidine kinase
MTRGRSLATVGGVHVTSGNRRFDRLGPIQEDGLVAAALLATILVCVSFDEQGPPLTVGYGALAAVTCAPLAVRSRWPLPVLVAVVVGTLLSIATYDPNLTIALPAMFALYTVALTSDRRTTRVVAFAVVPANVVAIALFSNHGVFAVETLKNFGLALLPLAIGSAKRDHRAYIAAIEERADRAERTREEEALRRVGQERLRIARELHDVVAHAMVAINVQAGVATHLMDRRPESARGALEQIKRVSGEALTDLRATLGVLRQDDDSPAPTRPAQGLDALEELADGMRAAGVEVAIEVSGDRCAVPSAIASALFRTIQEALTNVLRHSASRAATVRVEVCDGSARVEILDDGPSRRDQADAGAVAAPAGANGHAKAAANGAPANGKPATVATRRRPGWANGSATEQVEGTGNGLRGMRERIAAVGGVVEAGPRSDGGWRVHALLPLPREAA